MDKNLSLACRLNTHTSCVGHTYWGSIFGEATPCSCTCHKEAKA